MTTQKNRYLQLDGTPVESGEWRRYVSPWTLAVAFTGALVGVAIPSEKSQIHPAKIFAMAALGVAGRGLMRHRLITSLNAQGLQDYVIDTQPESRKHVCTEPEMNQFLFQTKSGAFMSASVGLGVAGITFASMPAMKALAADLSFIPITFTHSFEGFYLARKVEKNEWILVGRGTLAQAHERAGLAPALTK